MRFITQRILNNFPEWTKARRDPSSLAARSTEPLGEILEEMDRQAVRVVNEFDLLKYGLGLSTLWSLPLSGTDLFTWTILDDGTRYPVYHTSVVAAGPTTVTRVETMEEMLHGVPDDFALQSTASVSSTIVWQSTATTTYGTIPVPDRLQVAISGTTDWKLQTTYGDRFFGGFSGFVLTGVDANGLEFTETLHVTDDGTYITRNIFAELTDVKYDGFNGGVIIRWAHVEKDWVEDPYRAGVSMDHEGPLRLSLETFSSGGTKTVLRYQTPMIKRGDQYRRDNETIDENTEWLGDQVLRDSGSGYMEAVDLAINPWNDKLYVLDAAAYVHVYDYGLTAFSPPQERVETRESYIELRPLEHYPRFGNSMRFWTYMARVRYPIKSVVIRRTDPAGTITYLQANKTWGVGSYSFSYEPENLIPEDSWVDFGFTSDFTVVGQWDFDVTTVTTKDTTVSQTSVMCDYADAGLSFDASGDVTAPGTGLYFAETGELCVLGTGDMARDRDEKHVYFADPGGQQLLFREEYSSVTVTP